MAGNSPERPILFMKTGVVGSEPLGFYQRLAEVFDADLHSVDYVHMQLNNGDFNPSSGLGTRVNEEVRRRSLESLQAGFNTVYDGFLNVPQRRFEVRRKVAVPAGASTVLLCVRAPWELVEERLLRRHGNNQLSIPSALIPDVKTTVELARNMVETTKWPIADEPCVYLDGQEPVEALLAEVFDHVATQLAASSQPEQY